MDGRPGGRPARLDPPPGRVAGVEDDAGLRCNRCGFPVVSRPMGCKNPCANCGTVYPLGDCSD